MEPLKQAIGWLLAVFYSLVPSLGVAIVLLTCTVMLLLFPLTAKQARSMIAMQRVQPEIKKIQQKYKTDKKQQNEEIMRYYQENRINPLSGCLPLLMQMPVFFALFGVLRKIQNHVPTTGAFSDLFRDICGTAVDKKACSDPLGLHFLGMDLSVAPNEASGGFFKTLPYFILVGLVVLTGWYQARQTMARQRSTNPQAMNAQAQIIGKVMPIVFGLVSVNFASGLVLYFVTSNTWRIGQQHLVLAKMYDKAAAESANSSGTPPPIDASSREKPPRNGRGGLSPGPTRKSTGSSGHQHKKKKRKR